MLLIFRGMIINCLLYREINRKMTYLSGVL